MVRRLKQPPRLDEALGHIQVAGNLMPMEDVTLPQLDRLWDYIVERNLAVMLPAGTWALTQHSQNYLTIVKSGIN